MAENPPNKMTDEEMKQIFDKFYKMKNELVINMEALYQKAGVSEKEIKTYLDNPQNFDDRQWKKLKEQREEYKRKIMELAGKEAFEREEKKTKKKESEARSRKMLGSRRNWIPMR